MTVLCNQDDILNAHATNALVTLEHLLVDVLRVAHRGEQVWREVAARFDGLARTSRSQIPFTIPCKIS